jgi:nitroimidazol reductase NimA-like FMN-containing flavoprotein (pyridoxamine 5'-phosphate oxidase superfamily)
VRVHELSRAECLEVLGRAQIARLACTKGDEPYVVPIYVAFDGADLYGFSTLGQKIVWLRENPRVCALVEEIVDGRDWTTVLAFGRYQELSRPHEDAAGLARAEALLARRPAFWLPGAAKVGPHEHGTPVLYRIAVERLSGRRSTHS